MATDAYARRDGRVKGESQGDARREPRPAYVAAGCEIMRYDGWRTFACAVLALDIALTLYRACLRHGGERWLPLAIVVSGFLFVAALAGLLRLTSHGVRREPYDDCARAPWND